jgi:replicative DNA helicase
MVRKAVQISTLRVDPEPPLPHNPDAERSVLGAVLLDNQALNVALQHVRQDDFFLRHHRRIIAAMIALDVSRRPIDTISLMEHLQSAGELEAAGGVAYLSQLADGLPRVTNVAHYAGIVREKAVLRNLVYSASAIQDRAMGGGPTEDIVEGAIKSFTEIRENQTAGTDDLFDTWEEFLNAKPFRFLISDFLPADTCSIVGGLSGDGKTLMLQE